MQEAWVPLLVGELRSHMPHSAAKKKRKQISGCKGEIQEGRPWKIWPGLQKPVRELLYDLATPLLQIYLKEVNTETQTFIHLGHD